MAKKCTVFIVDDHEVVQAGLKALLDSDCISIVGSAYNLAEAKEKLSAIQSLDVVLLDIRLPDGFGYELCKSRSSFPSNPKILILTSAIEQKIVDECLKNGVNGYIIKDAVPEKLRDVIVAVANGETFLDPQIQPLVIRSAQSSHDQYELEQRIALLSKQEIRIVGYVAEGKTNPEIAVSLDLSEQTVKNYLNHAMTKLCLARRSQVAVFYHLHLAKLQ